jgi:lysophospholipase L1-like esterase
MISRIKKGSKSKIYFNTLLPVRYTGDKQGERDEHITWLNKEIRKLAGKRVTIIDLYPHFIDTENRLKENLTSDGLHLNARDIRNGPTCLKQVII